MVIVRQRMDGIQVVANRGIIASVARPGKNQLVYGYLQLIRYILVVCAHEKHSCRLFLLFDLHAALFLVQLGDAMGFFDIRGMELESTGIFTDVFW